MTDHLEGMTELEYQELRNRINLKKIGELTKSLAAKEAECAEMEKQRDFFAGEANDYATESEVLRAENERLRESLDLSRDSVIRQVEQRAETAESRVEEIEAVVNAALTHQVSNIGTDSEFYNCYTYSHGKFPDWVTKARALLDAHKETSDA